MSTTASPCTKQPELWIMPGDAVDWPATAAWAAGQCRRSCTRLIACAREALTAGNLDGHGQDYPADGVIMGGVVCTGGPATRKALVAVIDKHAPAPRPTHCLGCRQPMATRTRPQPGHVRHESGGACAACVRKSRRTSAAATVVAVA